MIDNFDQLLMRCKSLRRRRYLRITAAVGSILLALTGGWSLYHILIKPKIHPKIIFPLPQKTKTVQNDSPIIASDINTTHIDETAQMFPISSGTVRPVLAKPRHTLPSNRPAGSQPLLTHTSSPEDVPPTVTYPQNSLFQIDTRSSSNPVDAYYENPNYDTAMIAARHFYTKDNFSEAEVWAKKANRINREHEEAWLLYAKSIYAQGRSEEAIQILELYLQHKESNTAIELIKGWKK